MAAKQEQSAPEYFIKRGWRSAFRLNLNHLLMKEVQGGLIHSSIPTESKSLRIADVGTGTAAWALETAVKYPNAQVDGFDVSDEQFSPLFNIRNVNLVVHDCYKPFPDEYIGKYDIVNARFWLCIVNNPDAPKLLERLTSLLRPGGYLQWFEPQVLSITPFRPEKGGETPVMDKFVQLWKKPREDTTYDWVEQLPDLFRAQGLQNVAATEHVLGDQWRAIWMQSNLAGLEDTVTEELVDIGKAEQIKQFSAALQAEIRKGVSLHAPFTCVVGQKSA